MQKVHNRILSKTWGGVINAADALRMASGVPMGDARNDSHETDLVSCQDCGGRFKGSRGLGVHRSRMHRATYNQQLVATLRES